MSTEAMQLLEASAPLARAIADHVCATTNGRDSCVALHGVWLDLRLLGLGADPSRHGDFYDRALARSAADAPRVLIAGCADWGMLATAAAAYRRVDAALAATVVDRCPTPLLLCAWYAARLGLPVRTCCTDVARLDTFAPFDVICTHSLLTYFALPARRALLEHWCTSLRPGGRVVMVTRLDATRDVADTSSEPAAIAFGERVAARFEQSRRRGDVAELRRRAERFARAQVRHPIGNAGDLEALFESAGFVIENLDVCKLEGTLASATDVVGAARSGSYGEIVAVKP
jgi:SAM-dependent methyltransferase